MATLSKYGSSRAPRVPEATAEPSGPGSPLSPLRLACSRISSRTCAHVHTSAPASRPAGMASRKCSPPAWLRMGGPLEGRCTTKPLPTSVGAPPPAGCAPIATTARCQSGTAVEEADRAMCASRSRAWASTRRRLARASAPVPRRHHSLSARPRTCDAPAHAMASARATIAKPMSTCIAMVASAGTRLPGTGAVSGAQRGGAGGAAASVELSSRAELPTGAEASGADGGVDGGLFSRRPCWGAASGSEGCSAGGCIVCQSGGGLGGLNGTGRGVAGRPGRKPTSSAAAGGAAAKARAGLRTAAPSPDEAAAGDTTPYAEMDEQHSSSSPSGNWQRISGCAASPHPSRRWRSEWVATRWCGRWLGHASSTGLGRQPRASKPSPRAASHAGVIPRAGRWLLAGCLAATASGECTPLVACPRPGLGLF
eukprot:scaffold2813_cov121-Isochrysis_galbana.AAC.4